jgi:hypothetical protein
MVFGGGIGLHHRQGENAVKYILTTGETITTSLTANFGWSYVIAISGRAVAGDLGYMSERHAYAAAVARATA